MSLITRGLGSQFLITRGLGVLVQIVEVAVTDLGAGTEVVSYVVAKKVEDNGAGLDIIVDISDLTEYEYLSLTVSHLFKTLYSLRQIYKANYVVKLPNRTTVTITPSITNIQMELKLPKRYFTLKLKR